MHILCLDSTFKLDTLTLQHICQSDLGNKVLVVENCFFLCFQLLSLLLHVSIFIVIPIITLLFTLIFIIRDDLT